MNFRSASFIIILAMSLGSCVTMFNGRNAHVKVYSDAGAQLVCDSGNDYVRVYYKRQQPLPLSGSISIPPTGIGIEAPRERGGSLKIHVKKDTADRTVVLHSRIDPVIYWDFIFPYAFIVDLVNPKRFGYQRKVYIPVDSAMDIRKYYSPTPPAYKNKLTLDLSFPLLNQFYYNFDNRGFSSRVGVAGFGLGGTYYTSDKQSWTFQSGFGFCNSIRLTPGVYENYATYYFALRRNYIIDRLELGYGFCLATNHYRQARSNWLGLGKDEEIYHFNNAAIGPSLTALYRIGNNFNAGVQYNPTIFSLGTEPEIRFQYAVSLNFGWRIPLNASIARQTPFRRD